MTTYLHKIKAQLYDNVLTDDPNDFIARVISEKSLSTSDICESAVERVGIETVSFGGNRPVELLNVSSLCSAAS
ncbi:MAG: hypothetical protein FWG13_03925 [Leptospirales bacterium]|nr:hypothetical protein [Leptospirales bacterium]